MVRLSAPDGVGAIQLLVYDDPRQLVRRRERRQTPHPFGPRQHVRGQRVGAADGEGHVPRLQLPARRLLGERGRTPALAAARECHEARAVGNRPEDPRLVLDLQRLDPRVMPQPALAKMSGITKIPLSSRILSALAVVGPFAPSQMIFALIFGAFLLVITFSIAAGTSTSQSQVSSCSLVIASAPGKPVSWRWSLAQAIAAPTSIPFALYRAPLLSPRPTIFAPFLDSKSAVTEPTLPNPWTATRAPSTRIPSLARASRVTKPQPRPVASRPPSAPPIP